MDKETILTKAKKENDEFEMEVILKSLRLSFIVMAVFAVLLYVVFSYLDICTEILLKPSIAASSMMAVLLSGLSVAHIYKYVKLKNKDGLVYSILYPLLTVMYIVAALLAFFR